MDPEDASAPLRSSAATSPGAGVGDLVRELLLPVMNLHTKRRSEGLRYDLMCQVFRRLPNVATPIICDFDWSGFMKQLSPGSERIDAIDQRAAIAAVFGFPRLKTLLLYSTTCNCPAHVPALIFAFPSLKTLQLKDINCVVLSPDISASIMTPSIDLKPVDEILTALLMGSFGLRLRRFERLRWPNRENARKTANSTNLETGWIKQTSLATARWAPSLSHFSAALTTAILIGGH
ncbi:hypothetical protein DAEQUDRAFT_762092 [Daedalea quercina L-15889]|uniref:F-box domain-containing protein n=1 Tax=Daedalea quercina L-15889 TaxID=1314783 RepID=A0A165TM80_9APHY|nr:hypothetical protein DAEQUDRAFT_762092 [Daedalea quercina L-15889]